VGSRLAPVRALGHLFEANRAWADGIRREDPAFFDRLADQQSPRYLWIGCSDSRVPANQIVGMPPGDVFVHRNVANVVVHTDLNCLSVLQYAVDVLQVEHVIVCGHYGCGGVAAALRGDRIGLIDNWLQHVQDVAEAHGEQLAGIDEAPQRERRLCELNVVEQVRSVGRTTIVQDAWGRGRSVTLHGWIYDVRDGLLHDLDVTCSDADELAVRSRAATSSPSAG